MLKLWSKARSRPRNTTEHLGKRLRTNMCGSSVTSVSMFFCRFMTYIPVSAICSSGLNEPSATCKTYPELVHWLCTALTHFQNHVMVHITFGARFIQLDNLPPLPDVVLLSWTDITDRPSSNHNCAVPAATRSCHDRQLGE